MLPLRNTHSVCSVGQILSFIVSRTPCSIGNVCVMEQPPACSSHPLDGSVSVWVDMFLLS